VIASNGENRFVGHIVLDAPAKDPTLNFENIARALAEIVNASEPQFAVGIFGGWGSGKSTLMDAIKQQVKPMAAVVVEFNAWRYEREPHLIVPLLDTIRAGLSEWAVNHPQDEKAAKVKSIAARIGRVIQALVRATTLEVGLPGAVKISMDPDKALKAINEGYDDPSASPQSLYYAAFEQLNSAFEEVQRAGLSRIIVFVDDLDRCLPERALTVLESMKLFFDTKGFIFIVGLDERVVQSAVRTKFAMQPDDERNTDRQIEREYLNKMFQLPYTLPKIAPSQLDELLGWLDKYGSLGDEQRRDLNDRVKKYLSYVAKEGRINPREVKRYINAYTLQRMIRPDLDADTTLALQTMDFRGDWERFYEEIVLAEPDVFVEILRSFRNGDDHAFEDVWPEVGVLSIELSGFLRSDLTAMLAGEIDLERYVSSLETTRSTQWWVKDAMRDVGLLRRHSRDVPDSFQSGSFDARTILEEVTGVLGRLDSLTTTSFSGSSTGQLVSSLAKLRNQFQLLIAPSLSAASPADRGPTTPDEVQEWKNETAVHINALQEELRLIRRASAVGLR
jgi:energy-coupling factor transporter ATP-binding protein EcfA2